MRTLLGSALNSLSLNEEIVARGLDSLAIRGGQRIFFLLVGGAVAAE